MTIEKKLRLTRWVMIYTAVMSTLLLIGEVLR
jgi:hypothetical protein